MKNDDKIDFRVVRGRGGLKTQKVKKIQGRGLGLTGVGIKNANQRS